MAKVTDLREHACPDWDYLEIGPKDPEWGCCTCPKKIEHTLKGGCNPDCEHWGGLKVMKGYNGKG